MGNRRDILLAHYARVIQRSLMLVSMVSLALVIAMPMSASAYSQITGRSVAVSTSDPTATGVSYTFAFKPATTEIIGAVGFELCDQAYEISTTCTQIGGASGASLASATFGSGTADFASGWTIGNSSDCGTGAASTNTCIYDGSGVSVSSGTPETVTLNGVTNPSGVNSTYYANIFITTVGGASSVYTAPVDFGAAALATGQQMVVQAAVQEDLTFCVGASVANSCTSATGSSVSLATSAPCPVLSTTYTCTGTSGMAAYTNASSGYTISYDGSAFTNATTGHVISEIGSSPAASNAGQEQFGLAGTGNADVGSGTFENTYCYSSGLGCTSNGSEYAFHANTPENIAYATGPTGDNNYTVTYLANVDGTTNPGLYTSTINYVCTGNF